MEALSFIRGLGGAPLRDGGRDGGDEDPRLKLTPEAVETALRATGGNKVRAAKMLGVGRATLYRFFERKRGDNA
jgi:DNA-binding NtrC family response regulator